MDSSSYLQKQKKEEDIGSSSYSEDPMEVKSLFEQAQQSIRSLFEMGYEQKWFNTG